MADVFQAVYAVSSNDVWAVGYQEPVGFQFQPLIEHWDGTVWTEVPAPTIEGDSNFLYDVSGTGPEDVWAAGPLGGTGAPPLTLHWDGSAWSMVPAAYGPNRSYALLAVKAVAPNDVWAVGQWVTLDLSDGGPAAEHWDGATWTITRLRSPGTSGTFRGVGATSSNDVWAVGFAYDASFDSHPLAEHSKGPCAR
jgi:hypothetical protein